MPSQAGAAQHHHQRQDLQMQQTIGMLHYEPAQLAGYQQVHDECYAAH
jgi:hypothetical protein